MITLDLLSDLTEAIKRVNHVDKTSSATIFKYALLEQVDHRTLELTTYTKNLASVTQKITSTATPEGITYLILFQDLEKLCSRFKRSNYSCQIKQSSNGLTLSTFATSDQNNQPMVLDTVVLGQYHGTTQEFQKAPRETKVIATLPEETFRRILSAYKQYGHYTTSPRTIVWELDPDTKKVTFYGNHIEGRNYILRLELLEVEFSDSITEPLTLYIDGGYIDALLDCLDDDNEEKAVIRTDCPNSNQMTVEGSMGLITLPLNEEKKETIASTWKDFFKVGEVIGDKQTSIERCLKAISAQQPTSLYNNKMLQLSVDEDPTKLTVTKVGDAKKVEQSILYLSSQNLKSQWKDISVGSKAILDSLSMIDRFKPANQFIDDVVFLLHSRTTKKRNKVRHKYLLNLSMLEVEQSNTIRANVASIVNLSKS